MIEDSNGFPGVYVVDLDHYIELVGGADGVATVPPRSDWFSMVGCYVPVVAIDLDGDLDGWHGGDEGEGEKDHWLLLCEPGGDVHYL